MMIDSVASPPDSPAAARRRAESDGAFSYAKAAAALERGAGRSLQAHGGRPEGATLTPGSTSRPATDPDRSTAKAATKTAAGDGRSSPPPADARNTAAPDAPAPMTPVAPPAQSPGRSAAPPPSPALTVAPTVNLVAAKPLAPAGAASGETARVHNAPKLGAPSALGPVRSPDDLAQLIARRLDEGASEFEFRLDPPELGRIEGRLTLGDDGAARLTVAFDNQAAYDLFARDEAALRLAFANAGLDFGRGALAFVLEERRSAESPAPKETTQPYIALVAARALDVRV